MKPADSNRGLCYLEVSKICNVRDLFLNLHVKKEQR